MNLLVLSRNPALYSTQAIVDAGRKRNHYVRVVDHMLCDLVTGGQKSEVYYAHQPLQKIDAIIPRIGHNATFLGAAVIRQFENNGVFTTISSDALLKVRDKLSCLQLLEGKGIPVPKTLLISQPETIPYMLRQMEPYPIIIKLVTGTQGVGVVLAENQANAESMLEAFHATGENVVVQKFIKEANGEDIRAFVINGRLVAAMKRKAKPGDFRANLHRGGTSATASLTSIEEETAIRAAEALGLPVAGVDMLQSCHGPVVLEVNASPGLEGITATTGLNIAKEIINYIEQQIL